MAGLKERPHGGVRYAKDGCRCRVCKDGHNEYARRYRTAHRQEERAKLNAKRARDPEPHRAEARAYYRRHRDEIRERQRNPSQATIEARRLGSIRRKARKRAAPGNVTSAQLAARWAYYGGKCWMCGEPADTWDHVKPLSKGGSNWPSNLRPACRHCNCSKQARRVA